MMKPMPTSLLTRTYNHGSGSLVLPVLVMLDKSAVSLSDKSGISHRGLGWKVIKFHLLTHSIDDIKRWGAQPVLVMIIDKSVADIELKAMVEPVLFTLSKVKVKSGWHIRMYHNNKLLENMHARAATTGSLSESVHKKGA